MAKTRNFWPRSYTLEEKIALVTEIERRYRAGGVTLKAAAQAAGTTDTSYNNWIRAGIRPLPLTRPAPPRPYPPEERKRLLQEVEALLAGGMGIDAACRKVGISDSNASHKHVQQRSAYHWLRRSLSGSKSPQLRSSGGI